jgi:hypothetical protein
MLEMQIVLGAVLRERELEPLGGAFALPRRRNITITPRNGCLMRLRKRASSAAPPGVAVAA